MTKNIPNRTSRFVGLAVLALLSGPAIADVDGIVPAAIERNAQVPDSALGGDVDHQVRLEGLGLRQSGLIDIQSQIGADLIVIDRLHRRAQAIQTLLGMLGTDGLRQFDPELYAAMESSPIVVNQRIAELRLLRTLEEEQMKEPGSIEEQVVAPTQGRAGPIDIFSLPPFAPDPALRAQEPAELIQDLLAAAEQIVPAEPAAPPIVDFPISLREILGSNGEFRAVVLHGNELIRIEAGDRLPNDTEILEVKVDHIKVRRRDNIFEIHLRG